MGKYEPLGEFLRSQKTAEVPMSFAEIERITGTPLPPKAQDHRAWWSNNPSNNVMTKVWLAAGFETERVDMAGRRLVFRRTRPSGTDSNPGSSGPEGPVRMNASQHPAFGALKGLIRVMPETDLTEPADPAWSNIQDQNY